MNATKGEQRRPDAAVRNRDRLLQQPTAPAEETPRPVGSGPRYMICVTCDPCMAVGVLTHATCYKI